ncbi:MAG: outer membrane protein assembly factor BamA [Planctomycetota bacterium]
MLRFQRVAYTLVLAFIWCWPAPGAAQDGAPQAIQSIEIEGLNRLQQGEILSRLKLRPGDTFRPESLDLLYQNLWALGEFLAIEEPRVLAGDSGVRIVARVTEKVRIDKVEIVGYDAFALRTLQSLLQTRVGGLLDWRDLNRDARLLIRYYREHGYHFVDLGWRTGASAGTYYVEGGWRTASFERGEGATPTTPTVESLSDPRAGRITFVINEGPKVHVSVVRFYGNDSFEDGDLLRFMRTRPRSSFLGFPHSGLFDRQRYEQDLRNLKAFYIAKGFFDAEIAAEDYSFSLDRSQLFLGIRIAEGTRYKVAATRFEVFGPGVFTEDRLRQETELTVGSAYDDDIVQDDLRRIDRLYKRHSYMKCKVRQRVIHSLTGNDVEIVYLIEEGEQIYVENVEIRGNEDTRDKIIRRQVRLYPGEKFNYDEMEWAESRLNRTQYFKGPVRVYPEDGTTPSQMNVIVDVEEAPTGSINFGFGVTSGQGAIGILSLRKRNFDYRDLPEGILDFPNAWTGGGQTLIIRAEPGTDESRYHFEFREPHIFDSNTTLFLRAFRNQFNRDDYEEQRTAAEIGLGQRFSKIPDLSAEISYRYEVIDIDEIDAAAPPDVFAVEGDNRLSMLALDLSYDRRKFQPRGLIIGGWLARVGYEYGGAFLGADVDISKARLTFDYYQTLRHKNKTHYHVLVLRNTFRWAEPHHNTADVPIFERYFLGGARSLRGFRYREVGPHFGREPIGGTVLHFGSLEYTFPIVDGILRGIGFADYGNLSSNRGKFALDRYRLALGGGVLINVDLLGQRVPISLTWGEAVASEDGDRERLFLFDIGYGF